MKRDGNGFEQIGCEMILNVTIMSPIVAAKFSVK